MKMNVTRQAVCAADDQLNELDMTVDVYRETTLADCVARIQGAHFLQFSSTQSGVTGYLDGRAVVRLFATRPAEYLVAPDFRVAGTAVVASLSFNFESPGAQPSSS